MRIHLLIILIPQYPSHHLDALPTNLTMIVNDTWYDINTTDVTDDGSYVIYYSINFTQTNDAAIPLDVSFSVLNDITWFIMIINIIFYGNGYTLTGLFYEKPILRIFGIVFRSINDKQHIIQIHLQWNINDLLAILIWQYNREINLQQFFLFE